MTSVRKKGVKIWVEIINRYIQIADDSALWFKNNMVVCYLCLFIVFLVLFSRNLIGYVQVTDRTKNEVFSATFRLSNLSHIAGASF